MNRPTGMRSRQAPNAEVLAGCAHSVAMIMAARAAIAGKKQYRDRPRGEIIDRPVT
jgi:protein gp37